MVSSNTGDKADRWNWLKAGIVMGLFTIAGIIYGAGVNQGVLNTRMENVEENLKQTTQILKDQIERADKRDEQLSVNTKDIAVTQATLINLKESMDKLTLALIENQKELREVQKRMR